MGSDAMSQGGVDRDALLRGGGRQGAPTLDELRRRMAAVPGRGESAAQRVPLDGGSRKAALPVPAALAPLLPDGGLSKGSVVAYTGASSLLAGLLAAVTESGGHAAVVGMPRLGLLAAVEMGAQLRRRGGVKGTRPPPGGGGGGAWGRGPAGGGGGRGGGAPLGSVCWPRWKWGRNCGGWP